MATFSRCHSVAFLIRLWSGFWSTTASCKAELLWSLASGQVLHTTSLRQPVATCKACSFVRTVIYDMPPARELPCQGAKQKRNYVRMLRRLCSSFAPLTAAPSMPSYCSQTHRSLMDMTSVKTGQQIYIPGNHVTCHVTVCRIHP